MILAFSNGAPYYGMMAGYSGVMNGYYGMMGAYGGWSFGAEALGLVSGIGVLVGAMMIFARPTAASNWGLMVLIFSVLSFFGMGGFFIGAILGVIGGALAMASRPGAAPR